MDWDFETDAWQLDAGRYVSYPKSLRGGKTVLSRDIRAKRLVEGCIESWILKRSYYPTGLRGGFTFRNQSLGGLPNIDNCYTFRYRHYLSWELSLIINGVSQLLHTFHYTPATGLWRRWRISWWQGYDADNRPCLCIQPAEWHPDYWDDRSIYYDYNDEFAETPRANCGLYLRTLDDQVDDTYIYFRPQF